MKPIAGKSEMRQCPRWMVALTLVSLVMSAPAAGQGLPAIPPEREKDLHGLEAEGSADLRIFMAGNQFFLMPELLQAFQAKHPEVKAISYVTLPANADKFLAFMKTREAQAIYAKYGFVAAFPTQ